MGKCAASNPHPTSQRARGKDGAPACRAVGWEVVATGNRGCPVQALLGRGQARYYDFNVWSERKFVEKLRYIHRNPVTRGLVSQPQGWPRSSFRHYATGEAGAVEIESQWTARARAVRDRSHCTSPCPRGKPPPKRSLDGAPSRFLQITKSGPPRPITVRPFLHSPLSLAPPLLPASRPRGNISSLLMPS